MIGLLSTSHAFQLKRRSQSKSKAERLTSGLPVSMALSKNDRSFGETTVAVSLRFIHGIPDMKDGSVNVLWHSLRRQTRHTVYAC